MRLFRAVLVATLLAPCITSAQTNPPSPPPPRYQPVGPTGFLQLQGASTSLGLVMSADIDLGYNITEHLGGDIGLPFVFVRSPFSLVANHDWVWTSLLSEPYIDLRYTTARSGIKITSVLTGTIPAASAVKIFSTGRFGGDWFNHLEPEASWLKGFKPFLNAGASNGTINRYYIPRPYTTGRPYQTLGFMGDFEAGASFELMRGYRIGGSAYALVPAGPQKVFSRLITPGSGVVGDANHGRVFNNAFLTSGHPDTDRDHGFSGWLELATAQNVSLQVGYTRSVRYAYDSVSVVVNLDATSLIRTVTGRK